MGGWMGRFGAISRTDLVRGAIFTGHVLAFLIVSFILLRANIGWLFAGGDGQYPIHMTALQAEWSPFGLGFPNGPLQGLGDLIFPLNTRLDPVYLVPSLLFGADAATRPAFHVTAMMVSALEVFLATLVLARMLRLNGFTAYGGAWITPLLVVPYFGLPLIGQLYVFVPHVGTISAATILIISALGFMGRVETGPRLLGVTRRDWLCGAVVTLLLAQISLSTPAVTILAAPIIAAGAIGLIAGAESGRERLIKAAGLAGPGAVLVLCGLAAFVAGLFVYTVPAFFAAELENDRTTVSFISIWFQAPYGHDLVLCAGAGAIAAIILGPRRFRWFTVAMGLLLATLIGVFGWLTLKYDFWRGPSPSYFESLCWPIYGLYAAYLFSTPAVVARRLGVLPDRILRNAAIALGAIPVMAGGFALAHVADNPVRVGGHLVPPTLHPSVARLREEIAIAPGAPFRGRVFSLVLAEQEDPVGWGQLAGPINAHITRRSNDYFWMGLWWHAIPTLWEYSQTMSPAYYRLVVDLVGREGDRQQRNVIVLRDPEARTLAMLGVAYVLSDAPLPAPFEFVMEEDTGEDDILRLYAVPDVNLGQYAPTRIVTADSFAGATGLLAGPDFDPRTTAVLFADDAETVADADLTPASGVALTMERGGYDVQAASDGASLLALPFEYSHCWTVHGGRQANARLVRLNAAETGLYFEGEADVRIRFFNGPFWKPACRIRDYLEFKRLAAGDGD